MSEKPTGGDFPGRPGLKISVVEAIEAEKANRAGMNLQSLYRNSTKPELKYIYTREEKFRQ